MDTIAEEEALVCLNKGMMELNMEQYIASNSNEKAMQMMVKMGYKEGSGLGVKSQGIVQPIELKSQTNRRGLGHVGEDLDQWDFEQEHITVIEGVDWLICTDLLLLNRKIMDSWLKVGKQQTSALECADYCDSDLVQQVMDAKDQLDGKSSKDLCKARFKCNPFETTRSMFFMNRAALKMANIDAATDFMFTNVDRQKEHIKSGHPIYFADICAGPGGFSEYILWRKKWAVKAFGMTLKDENDFKLYDSSCAASETFQTLYGVRGDGNVYYPENITDFCTKVKNSTKGLGVHFLMADGGFSVEGEENMQEILSIQLFAAQCTIALKCLRKNGHFVLKLFDVYTCFSVGLVYLMYRCFEKVAIFKPNSSRPANSEKYLICSKLKLNSETTLISEYLEQLVCKFVVLKTARQYQNNDILEIVPPYILSSDKKFFNYIIGSNDRLARRQLMALNKLLTFMRNPSLMEPRQIELRTKCLEFWQIPDREKPRYVPKEKVCVANYVATLISNTSFMSDFNDLSEICNDRDMHKVWQNREQYHFTFVGTGRSPYRSNRINMYVGMGRNRVYRFQKVHWIRISNIELIRGTVLYAELVDEICNDTGEVTKSLHVVDAIRLGDISLAEFPYEERLELIQTYCQAVNKEYTPNRATIRVKPVFPLSEFSKQVLPSVDSQGDFKMDLPALLLEDANRFYNINGLLIFKTDYEQCFYSTFESRRIIYVHMSFTFEQFLQCVKENST